MKHYKIAMLVLDCLYCSVSYGYRGVLYILLCCIPDITTLYTVSVEIKICAHDFVCFDGAYLVSHFRMPRKRSMRLNSWT